jgi:iron complex outermembrane recepter protein
MHFQIKLSLVLLPILFFLTQSFSQSGKIEGTILSSTAQPIHSVNIYLKESAQGTVSDTQGNFSIENVKEGTHTLIASSVGYGTIQKRIHVLAGKTLSIQLQLFESEVQLDAVTVTNTRSLNEQIAGIGKAGIKAFDLPQSTMSITKEILEQQQTQQLSDVLRNVNGVYVMGTTGGNQEEIAGRGFAYNSSNTFKNGARFNNGVRPEMSSLEKVEVMKGSNAILFGNVAAGGVINLITKKPKIESGGEISMRAGSFDFYKPSIDIYGALDEKKKLAYRINTTYENAKSFRDEVESKRFYINPSFLAKLSKKTDLLIEADYLDDQRTLDYGTGAVDYTIAQVPRSRFLGAKWSYFAAQQKSLTATVSHQFNENWKLRVMTSAQGFQSDLFGTTRPNAGSQFVKADGTWTRRLQHSEVAENYYIGQADLIGRLRTGKIQHTLLIGADADGYNTQTTTYGYFRFSPNQIPTDEILDYDQINIFDLELYKQRTDIPELTKRTITKGPTQRIGAYVQDLIELGAKIKVLAGIRYTYLERQSNVYTSAYDKKDISGNYNLVPENNSISKNYDYAFTPRLGIVYQPIPTTSLFASYANSFNLNAGIDIESKPLPPSFIDQYEIGVKNELFKGLLSANVTAYQIVNSNLSQTVIITSGNPNNVPVNAQELAGEVTSQGLEVDIMTKAFKGFSIIGGYSFNETKYTKSNIFIEGSKLRYNPQHTANLSLFYTMPEQSKLKNFTLGTTLFYTGDRVAGRSTRLTTPNDTYKLMAIPNFLQVDATAGYSYKKISVKVRVSNIFDTLSYYVHDDNSVNPIAPRMVSTTVSFKL